MFRWRGVLWHLKQFGLAVDQLGNVLFLLGSADETISSRVGKAYRGDYGPEWKVKIRWFRNRLNAAFRLFGHKDHAKQSIEEDEGK